MLFNLTSYLSCCNGFSPFNNFNFIWTSLSSLVNATFLLWCSPLLSFIRNLWLTYWSSCILLYCTNRTSPFCFRCASMLFTLRLRCLSLNLIKSRIVIYLRSFISTTASLFGVFLIKIRSALVSSSSTTYRSKRISLVIFILAWGSLSFYLFAFLKAWKNLFWTL